MTIEHLLTDPKWAGPLLAGIIVLVGLIFAAFVAGAQRARTMLLSALNEWADSGDFAKAVDKVRLPVVNIEKNLMADKVRTMIAEHNDDPNAHRAALESYPTRLELSFQVEKIGMMITASRDSVTQSVAGMQRQVDDIHRALRRSGVVHTRREDSSDDGRDPRDE